MQYVAIYVNYIIINTRLNIPKLDELGYDVCLTTRYYILNNGNPKKNCQII